MATTRKQYSPKFKAKVAVEAIRGERTLSQLASQFHVLSWALSLTMELVFCVEALQRALRRGRPEIFNIDQGSQFTSEKFTGELERLGIAISMDGRGRCFDNIFIERLWRSLKYQEVYLREYASVPKARADIGNWFRLLQPTAAAPKPRLPATGGVVPEMSRPNTKRKPAF